MSSITPAHSGLKRSVEARDRLVLQTENAQRALQQQLVQALGQGDLAAAQAAADHTELRLLELAENLRIYQAELHAQADELATSQARTEALLTRFSTLFSRMPVAAMLVDESGEVLEFNSRADTLLGLRQRSPAARFMHRLVQTLPYQERVRPAFLEARATGASMLDEVPFISADGRQFVGELHLAWLPGGTGEQAGGHKQGPYACALIDRSEHLRDLQALRSSAEALSQSQATLADSARLASELTERLSVASAAGGIGVWDWVIASGQVVLDSRMARLLDLPAAVSLPEPELRRRMADMLQPDSAERLAQALSAAVTTQTPLALELRRRPAQSTPGAEASEHWLHLSGRTHVDTDGRALRVVGLAWDCSAEHEAARLLAAKESAEQASRSKSAFLSRMSHELRTPLNAILGFAQLMRMEAEAGDLVLKPHRVSLIETAARHLLELVNEVLDVSRIESGQLEVHLVRFDLRGVVQETLPLVQGLADSLDVRLADHSAQAPPCWVLGDRLRFKEVLINLLSNAVKYNRPGGQVEVQLRGVDDGHELAVADTGIGLDPKQLASLFQPFNRLGAEASGIEGSGMGLFVSRRFVELMGGRISVDSRPGQGTTFCVRLNAPPAG